MLTVATVLALLALPMAAVTVLLLVVGRVQCAREAEIGRQVSVTDAIHSELGAVVSPVVKRRFGHGWRIEIAVPFERPAIVGRVVSIAHAAMLHRRTGGGYGRGHAHGRRVASCLSSRPSRMATRSESRR